MMQWRRLLAVATLSLVAACSSGPYPYPPQFADSFTVSPRSIPQPPARYSDEYNREIDSIIAMQATLTPAELVEIKHQDRISPDKLLYPVVGERYSQQNYPALYQLLNRAASDAWRVGDETRAYWQSPRPWYADSRVALHVEPIYSPGYPSGHTTTFGVMAYVMADLMPQKADAFFTQAWSMGGNRIKGGAHFPHDIAGGKQLSAALYDAMRRNPAFADALEDARMEIRSGGKRHARAVTPGAVAHCH